MSSKVENSDYAIYNRKEIIFILEDLAKHRIAITLNSSDGVSFLTSVLEVNADEDYVYLDISPDERINQKVLQSKSVIFSTQGGVRVRWHAANLELVALADGDALSMEIPEAVERIQRREYFRLNTPQGGKALICKMPFENGFYEASLVDMSVGGIGLSIKGTPPPFISQGAVLTGCSIDFPGIGPVPLTLRVFGLWASVKTKSGEQTHHVGLAFEKLSGSASNVVQRYMIQLEIERINFT